MIISDHIPDENNLTTNNVCHFLNLLISTTTTKKKQKTIIIIKPFTLSNEKSIEIKTAKKNCKKWMK